jgi:hypothetical protein
MKTPFGDLSYCTNIHAGDDWGTHFKAIKENFSSIKSKLSPDKALGIGLRLSNLSSLEILEDQKLEEFKKWLKEVDAYVFTMNGFPFGEFHHTTVKDQVHAPDWLTEDRVNYTNRLFDILSDLVDKESGISTSPLSYRHWFKDVVSLAEATQKATVNMLRVLLHLIEIKNKKGLVLHLDIEPEPDGILESGQEFIDWYLNVLLPLGKSLLKEKLKISEEIAEKNIKEHIQLCYDVCHFALGYEKHAEVLEKLNNEGIKVGKIQISSALKANLPQNVERKVIKKAFQQFNEPIYLHQVITKNINGELIRYKDLPEALEEIDDVEVVEWRSHFHVPIFIENFHVLSSTQSDIVEVLNLQKQKAFTKQLEVETYTWEVTPEELKLPIGESIERELSWVKNQLS